MTRIILALLLLGCVFSSCNKQPTALTKEEIRFKVDSITKVRIAESDAQAQRDLDHRMKIEVKVKVDSIVNAKLNPASVQHR